MEFSGLSRTVCSEGGCRLNVIGGYFASNSDLALESVSGQKLCAKMVYKDIKKLECITLPGVVAPTAVQLRNNVNSAVTACVGSDCTYETSSGATALITKIVWSGNVGALQRFTITGNNLEVAAGAELYIATKPASPVTISSASEAIGDYATGLGFVLN